MDHTERRAMLADYSAARMTAIELRRRLGVTYGDVLRMLADEGLPLPRAPIAGREAKLAKARAWLFPRSAE